MAYKKESLEKLLVLIDEISKDKNNEWFLNELLRKINKDKLIHTDKPNNLIDLVNDIKRTKYFLNSIDKTIWLEGLNYYSNIKDPILKIELITDYKEMKISDKQNDIIEFSRRLIMQLENCLNAICIILDAPKIILASPDHYKDNSNNLKDGRFSFFEDGKVKQLNLVPITSKLFFVKKYYGFNYPFNILDEMIKIRNKSSHRGELSESEKNIINNAKKNYMEKKSLYFKSYNDIFKKLTDLFKT
ncbi:MAG: hypothetical protein U0T69_05875 [Chitinophagales bacterium]